MPQCVICGGDVSMLSQKRAMDGLVCNKCMGRIPHVVHSGLSLYSAKELQAIMDYEDEMRQIEFDVTSSYGKLHLDEMNGRFAICDKTDSNGKLIGEADIFDCVYLESIGLYAIDPRQSKRDIVCDVEFNCVFKYPRMKFKLKVRQGVKCEFKQVTKTQATWSEPGELSMFRNMLDQTIKTSVKKALAQREQIYSPYDIDLLKARACLHVYEGCQRDLIDQQFENMKKMYENGDYSESNRQSYMKVLRHYYRILISEEEKSITRHL